MSDFDAFLTRSFAEAPEPVDDGFTVRISEAVVRREKSALWLTVIQGVIMASAALAVVGGLMSAYAVFGPQLVSALGLELARAHGAMAQAAPSGMTSLAAGLTPLLLLAGALTGGALVYRQSQQQ